MLRARRIISLIILFSLNMPIFANGLALEITNNLNMAYTASLSTRTNYEDKPTYQYEWFKNCDNATLNLNNLAKASTWCGYKGIHQTGGEYAVINIKQNDSSKTYAKVIVTVDNSQLSRDIIYSEQARESTLHVHATCARFNSYDLCKISLDPQ